MNRYNLRKINPSDLKIILNNNALFYCSKIDYNRNEIWDSINDISHDYGNNTLVITLNNEVKGIAGWIIDNQKNKIFISPFLCDNFHTGNVLLNQIENKHRKKKILVPTNIKDKLKIEILKNRRYTIQDTLIKFSLVPENMIDKFRLNSNLLIKPIKSANADKLTVLINSCFVGILNTKELSIDDGKRIIDDKDVDNNNSLIVTDELDNYIGYILIMKDGQIDSIGVIDKFRRNQIASYLIQYLISNSQKKHIYAYVLKSNVASVSLFFKYNFKLTVYSFFYSKNN